MKTFTIEACGFGSFWVRDVNCPPGWYGSGCYDVEYECYQEATFIVCAPTLEKALKEIAAKFERYNTNYGYDLHAIYYDPTTVSVEIDDEECEIADLVDCHYEEPVNGESVDVPDRYSEEIE